ncbi:MAG: MSHA biogenesis protein MshG [Phycisphaerae bacterium]|nr:MAG: MSHA biogenesis protein MshG [Phycisphaerae bacterium]
MSARLFEYRAVDAEGKSRRGTILAADERDAFKRIAAARLTPLALDAQKTRGPMFSWQRLKQEDIVGLTRELAVLAEARIPIDRGLAAIAEHEGKSALTEMIRDIAARIESGEALTSALGQYREAFGEVYIETIRAGEKSGNLSAVMNHLAELLEKQLEVRQQLRRAMMYPAIVLSVVAVAVTVIVVFVVPKFAATFASQGAEMPLATRIIQALGNNVREQWYVYAGVLAGAVVSLMAAWSRPAGRFTLERLLLRVPYVRRIIVAVTAGRFARVLSIALESGLDLVEAVRIGGRSTGRPVFVAECEMMCDRLKTGEAFVDVIRSASYIPSFAKRMLGAGKDSAELAKSCTIVSRYYDREASHLTKNVNTVIEPLMTVAMAGIVLVVALAVFLPMWKMASINH